MLLDLENSILCQRKTYCMIALTMWILKNNIKEIYIYIYTHTHTHIQTQKASLWLPKRRGKRAGTNEGCGIERLYT